MIKCQAMLKLRPLIYSTRYKITTKSLTGTATRPRFSRYMKRLVYGSFLTSASVVTYYLWQNPQNIKNVTLQDGEFVKFQKWIYDEYTARVAHSSLMRFGRAAYAVVSVFIDYKYSLMGIDHSHEMYTKIKSQCHLRSAIKFKNLCSVNGGVFMKVGQHIGSLELLFPVEYTETLKCFQYEAPASCFTDVQYVIESDTGLKLVDLFKTIDEKPLGSASLAQVHKAVLKTGEVVAVKVQHRSVKDHAFQDAKVIEFFVKVAGKLFSEFKFQWLLDQINANLPLELDFLNEGKNCEKMGKILERFENLKVPKIHWKNSTKRVLFLEFISGGYVDNIEYIKKHKLDADDISTKLGHLYSEMIFVHGFIHCDPHPGNILVRKNDDGRSTDIILLDHGLYQTMSDTLRLNYCKLWQSMIQSDIEGIKTSSEALGVGHYYELLACIVTGRTWKSIQTGINQSKLSVEELTEVQSEAIKYVSEITAVLDQLPREMILIFKTNDLLRGLDARLKTSAASASFITMAKCCLKAVYHDDLAKSNSIYSKFRIHCKYAVNSLRLIFYQLSLIPSGSVVANILRRLQLTF